MVVMVPKIYFPLGLGYRYLLTFWMMIFTFYLGEEGLGDSEPWIYNDKRAFYHYSRYAQDHLYRIGGGKMQHEIKSLK